MGIYLHQQDTSLNQSDKIAINQKNYSYSKTSTSQTSTVNILFID